MEVFFSRNASWDAATLILCAKLSPDTANNCTMCLFSGSLGERRTKCRVQAREKVQLLGQWEPRSRSRITGIVLYLLSYRSSGDAYSAIEAFERCLPEYEGQSTHQAPEFVKDGIVINGIVEQSLRHHLVMHSARLHSNKNLQQEVFDIDRVKRARGTASTRSPLEVDARRDKGRGKGREKGQDNCKTQARTRRTLGRDNEMLVLRPQEVRVLEACSRQDQVDFAHTTSLSSSSPSTIAQQVSALTVSGRDPEEHLHLDADAVNVQAVCGR